MPKIAFLKKMMNCARSQMTYCLILISFKIKLLQTRLKKSKKYLFFQPSKSYSETIVAYQFR